MDDEYINKEKSLRSMCESKYPVQPQDGSGGVGGCDRIVMDFLFSSLSPSQQCSPPDGSCVMFTLYLCSLSITGHKGHLAQHDHPDWCQPLGVADRNTSLLHTLSELHRLICHGSFKIFAYK